MVYHTIVERKSNYALKVNKLVNSHLRKRPLNIWYLLRARHTFSIVHTLLSLSPTHLRIHM
jgi:hypothetical protein